MIKPKSIRFSLTIHKWYLAFKVFQVCLMLSVMFPTTAFPQDKVIIGLYDPNVLAEWHKVYAPIIEGWKKREIEPAFPDYAPVLDETSFTFLDDAGLFEFSSAPAIKNITISISAVKFLHDMTYVSVLTANTSYKPPINVLLYVAVLKYREAKEFPGGHYPKPFDVFGIPHDDFDNPLYPSVELQRAHELSFDGALLFLIAHEAGHVVLNHHGQMSMEQEIEADKYAISVIERRQGDPAGIMQYFLLSSSWVINRADAGTDAEYQSKLIESGHPLNGNRIDAAGRKVSQDAKVFFPGASDTDPRIPMVRAIGDKLVKVGYMLNDLANRTELRKAALDVDLATPIPQHNIHDAVKAGDLNKVAEHLASSPTLIHSEDKGGMTPLLWAVEKGDEKMVEFLLSKGSSINEKNKEGFTPLHAAAAAHQTAMLFFLLSKNADVNAKSEAGLTPLFLAADDNYEEGLSLLLSKGAQINATNTVGMTPLQLAASKGHTRTVALLLSKEANVNSADGAGFTPLLDAVRGGYQDVVELLLSKGANIDSKDVGGFTALHVAALNGRKSIAQTLVAKGANVNAKDENGDTPCQIAIKEKKTEVVDVLCTHR